MTLFLETTEPTVTTIAIDSKASLQGALAWVVAVFAAAGGLIHLQASIDHRDLMVIAVGFAAMAISQLVLAGVMLMRPSPKALIWVGALHAGIVLVWIISRTLGLVFIPGAEQAAEVGVADVVANTLSLAVVGVTIIALSLDRSSQAVPLHPSTARAINVVTLVGALILSVAALGETHDHAHNDGEAPLPIPVHSHDHDATP